MCRQQDLYRILKAYTIYRPDEGYCQAQAPVAAVLLMHMPAEVGGLLDRLVSTFKQSLVFYRMANMLCMHLLSNQMVLLKVILFYW